MSLTLVSRHECINMNIFKSQRLPPLHLTLKHTFTTGVRTVQLLPLALLLFSDIAP